MAFVDAIKAARGKLTDSVCPGRVVFHHVPKCGGTSVGRALRKRYFLSQSGVTPEQSFRAFEDFTGRTDREQMLVDVGALREQMLLYFLHHDIRCIANHVAFSDVAHAKFSPEYAFVTMLREPVERFVSHYRWSHQRTGAHARIEESFEAFLDTPRARRLGATYVEYFCGESAVHDLVRPALVERACANLGRLDVVGNLGDLKGFAKSIKQRLGVRISVGRENTGRRAFYLEDALSDDRIRRRLEDICAPDLEIWNHVRTQIW